MFHLLQCCQISILLNCNFVGYHPWHHNPHKRLSCLSYCTGTLLQQKPLPRVSFCMLQCSFVVAEYFLCLSQYEYHSILPCLPMDNKEEETPCAESNFYSEIIRSLLLAKNVFFGKQKLDVKQLKKNKFIFDVRQLKMNRFIKSISDLIISTSNATLEVASLRPCLSNYHLNIDFFILKLPSYQI